MNNRVLRVGSWGLGAERQRCAQRHEYGPGFPSDRVGFRFCFNHKEKTMNVQPITLKGATINTDDFGVYADLPIGSGLYRFRWIEPGKFLMGSPETELHRLEDETQHEVEIQEGYWMLSTPVTQGLYEDVVGVNPSHFRGERNLPVERVSWFDAKEFCTKLQALLGQEDIEVTLPTEEQWEYACRAGTTTPFWTGETITTDEANFHGEYPYRPSDPNGVYRGKTTPVDTFRPNPWGLLDMHGNVWEWCDNEYAPYPS